MTWQGQHFQQAPVPLVDPNGVDTGLFDPRALNWLAYLVATEGQRLAQALFGDSTRWRFATSVAWPAVGNAPETPMLYVIPTNKQDGSGWSGKGCDVTKTYSDGATLKTVTFQEPHCKDIYLTLRIAVRNEYPVLDLETKLVQAYDDVGRTITLANELIHVFEDVPNWRWNPADDDTLLSEQVWLYRSVPVHWTSSVLWGTVMNEATLTVEVLKALDSGQGEEEEIS